MAASDGPILEQILETNIKLRKQMYELLQRKCLWAEHGYMPGLDEGANAGAGGGGVAAGAEEEEPPIYGIGQFFKEASKAPIPDQFQV